MNTYHTSSGKSLGHLQGAMSAAPTAKEVPQIEMMLSRLHGVVHGGQSDIEVRLAQMVNRLAPQPRAGDAPNPSEVGGGYMHQLAALVDALEASQTRIYGELAALESIV